MDAVQNFSRNSVEIVGWSDDPLCIIMRRYDTSLDHLIFNRSVKTHINLTVVHSMLGDICSALMACEKLGIVHNDLKPRMLFSNSL